MKPKFVKEEMWDKFALINLTRVELGCHRKLLHMLDLTFIWLQQRYVDMFTY